MFFKLHPINPTVFCYFVHGNFCKKCKMKTIIGRQDKVDFPELQLYNIEAKTDTGAYTSSIHCREIKEVVIEGELSIRFILMDPSHSCYNDKEFITKNYTKKTVKNSFGTSEQRFAIKTEIKVFNKTFPIELTLSERSEMKYPVLLGRKFLTKAFMVDTSKKNLSFKQKDKE